MFTSLITEDITNVKVMSELVGTMRRRLIFEDINQLTIICFTTQITYINHNS